MTTSPFRIIWKNVSLPLVASLVLVGCSQSRSVIERKPRELPTIVETSGIKVSVESNGRPVKNFAKPLVHRVELTPSQAEDLRRRWSVVAKGAPAVDVRGKPYGVELRSPWPELGLHPGDVLTAVEKTHIADERGLLPLFGVLQKNGSATFTFERSGEPHKTLVYLKS